MTHRVKEVRVSQQQFAALQVALQDALNQGYDGWRATAIAITNAGLLINPMDIGTEYKIVVDHLIDHQDYFKDEP